MARLVFVLLVVAAAVLAVALALDRKRRGVEQLHRLRSAFLHGTPQGGDQRQAGLKDVVCDGGGLRLRIPGAWCDDPDAGGGTRFHDGSADGCRLRLESWTRERDAGWDASRLAEAVEGATPPAERSTETLPDGSVLVRCLDRVRHAGGDRVAYEWRLGRRAAPHQVRVAVFRLDVPLARADDVFVRSDVAIWDREIRNARFEEPAGSS